MIKCMWVVAILCVGIVEAKMVSSVGIQCGLNSTWQDWNYNNGLTFMEDRDIHYNAAITVDMFEHTYFNFSFGVTYLQKGGVDKSVMSTDETGAELYRIEVANRLDYVCFSPAIKLKYDFGVFVPFIIVGPSLDVQVAKKIVI